MQLTWFRQDLRLHDHAALWHATQAGPCIALVILSPAQWQMHDDAFIKIDFYLRQLVVLQQQLHDKNIPLMVATIPTWDAVPQALVEFCKHHKISSVHANIELGQNELQRDAHAQQQLEQNGIVLELYHDRTLFPVSSIRNKSQQPYQVFGAFKKQCYEKLSIGLPQTYPDISVQAPITGYEKILDDIPTLQALYPEQRIEPAQQALWPVGEAYALAQLDAFIEERVKDYGKARDFPALDQTSQLSTYLNIGILSVRQCIERLFPNGYLDFIHDGQQIWLDELLWREFYQHILFDFPRVSKHLPFKQETLRMAWRDAPDDLIAWQHGQTGIPIVDAGMRQMLATGWMHNRVRMICAMFLSKNLLIDWRLGEAWFMQHLIDGDLAANNGGWQWCASTGTDAVPYFRIFNPVSQSQRFDANGDYIRRWVPELAHLDAKQIHEPYAKASKTTLNYPRPIVDLKSSRVRAIDAFKHLGKVSL